MQLMWVFITKDTKLENQDFYYENGFMVFTEEYHLKRGHCCQSGCRHCPYINNNVKCDTENLNKNYE